MGLGAGFLKQMNDTIKYNRDLLGKKKSIREIYKDEIKKRGTNYEKQDLEHVRERVALALKRDRASELFSKIMAVVIAALIIGGLIWALRSLDFNSIKTVKQVDKNHLYKTIIYDQSNGLKLKTDYFIRGPKAAETYLKDGFKHQNSESYYESGQQFRTALYYYDTLITEIFLYNTGDTILNFPTLSNDKIYKIKLLSPSKDKQIEFDFFDGKIIQDTYQETKMVK
jgi:hypothetical protein